MNSWLRHLLVVLGLVLGGFSAWAQSALPTATVGVVYNFQVTTLPAAPAGTIYSAVGLPPGVSINVTNGLISGTPTAAGNYNATISLLTAGATTNLDVTIGVNAPAGTLAITSAGTATGAVGTAFEYRTTTTTVSGAPVASYNLGGVPPGLSGNATTGVISGTPTTVGVYPVSISANNLNGTGPVTVVTVTIGPSAGAPVISGATVAAVAVNAAFNYAVTASNSPTSYAAVGLPLGLSINPATGVISGTPTIAGTSVVALTASNASGSSAGFSLTITVGAVPVISSANAANAALGAAFSFGLTASNSPVSFSVSGLPPGLVVNTTSGAISGVPTATGVFPVTLSATNANGTGPVATLSITVGNVPVITSPLAASGTVGTPFNFSLTASNTPTAFTVTGLPVGLSATPLGAISGSPSTVGTYAVSATATNVFGTGPAAIITLTIAAAPVVPPPGGGGGGGGGGGSATPPTVTQNPVAQTVMEGGSVTFSVAATGTAPLSYQWRKDGLGLSGATASTFTLARVTPAEAGSYSVVVFNAGGSVLSAAATLTVQRVEVGIAPVITAQPSDQSAAPGTVVSFTVAASGTGTLSYQWRRDGNAITGATSSTYSIAEVRPALAGAYDVVVSNSVGTATSRMARLTVLTSRLLNVSVRSTAGTGDQTLIVGFRIEGTGTKQVLLRGVGPTLAQLNVLGALADPQLRLFDGAGVQTQQNDDWGGGETIAAASSRVGAFALPPTSKDAAMVVTLPSGAGTAHVTSTGGPGVALIEAYDSDSAASGNRFVNVSARTQVGTGEGILIAGFVIDGGAPKTVLIRGVGPGLVPLGIPASAALTDPQLRLFDGAGKVLRENNDWGGGAELSGAYAQVGAFLLPGPTSKDAAILVTLPPGGYTAQVSGVGESSGVALIEVYEVP